MTERPWLRRAGAADVPAAADVLVRSRRASVPAVPPMVHTAEETRNWLAGKVERGEQVWVAETVDGAGLRLVAVMVLGSGWVEQLYVAPGWTGAGVGAALVERAKLSCPAGLQLWTFQSNERARAFYARHGFVAEERTDGAGNEERAPDVRMAWRPGPDC